MLKPDNHESGHEERDQSWGPHLSQELSAAQMDVAEDHQIGEVGAG